MGSRRHLRGRRKRRSRRTGGAIVACRCGAVAIAQDADCGGPICANHYYAPCPWCVSVLPRNPQRRYGGFPTGRRRARVPTQRKRRNPAVRTVRVWHAVNPTFGRGPQPRWPSGYELAAEVDVASVTDLDMLEEAYRKTNTIDDVWWHNAGVRLAGNAPGRRSTSVGDVVELPGGDLYRVEGIGWRPLRR